MRGNSGTIRIYNSIKFNDDHLIGGVSHIDW